MRRFAALYRRLDRSTATSDKRAALIDYFREAPPEDAAWALWLLAGGKIGGARAKIAGTNELRDWIAEASGNPAWLVEESYHHVGDLAETLTLLLDDPPPEVRDDTPLHVWIEQRLLAVAGHDEATRARRDRRRLARTGVRRAPRIQQAAHRRLARGRLAAPRAAGAGRNERRGHRAHRATHARRVVALACLPARPAHRRRVARRSRATVSVLPRLAAGSRRPNRSGPSTTGCSSGNGMASACS